MRRWRVRFYLYHAKSRTEYFRYSLFLEFIQKEQKKEDGVAGDITTWICNIHSEFIKYFYSKSVFQIQLKDLRKRLNFEKINMC